MPITISIVEDNRGTREQLVALLEAEPGLRCLGAYATGEAALRGIPVDGPQVALVDINLPDISGIECVAKLKARLPELQVLMLTTYAETDLIFDSLRAGASGYLLKNRPPAELVQAIQQVLQGGAPMTMQIARRMVEHFHQAQPRSELEKLTPREQEILALVAKGKLYKEIGDQLSLSYNTVRAHVRNIYEKLHVQSRTQAAAKFFGRK
jgi:DNA-binding NarL/FixJ family response regulator